MTELGKQVWKKMEEMGWENAPVDFHLEYYENIIECTKQALTIEAIKELEHRFKSDTFIDNVCLSYRHDFILMAEQDRQRLRFECKEWMRAISNNWEYFKNGL